jgi:hypothetical protein
MTSSRMTAVWAGALMLTAACAASSAQADTLAPATVNGSVFFNFTPPAAVPFTTFGNFSLSGPGGLVRASASATPSPSMFSEVTIVPGLFTGRAGGEVAYQVQIIGPAGSVPVSVAVAASVAGLSNTIDPFAAFAMVARWRLDDVTLGLVPVFGEGIESGQSQGSFSQSFNHDVALTLTANHIYRVSLFTDAFASAASGPTAFASAFIDPVFSFAAGVGPEYSFQFSDGIGNQPVPEPPAVVLFALGALVLGRRLWHRAVDKVGAESVEAS